MRLAVKNVQYPVCASVPVACTAGTIATSYMAE